MSLFQTSLYEHLNKNSNLLYPGKNIKLITLHILGGDNYYKENAYNPNSEESIFSPNHTNEEPGDNLPNITSLDEDNEEKDHSLISKDSNFINFPSSDNYIEDNDDSLNSKFSFFSINQSNDKSRENLFNFPSSYNYIIKEYDSYFFINQTNNKSRENLFNLPSLDNNIIKNVDSQISKDNILSPDLIEEKSKNPSYSTSLDDDIKKNDDSLNSKDNVLPPSPKNEESKNNLNNLFKNNTDISSHNELIIEIESNNNQINESKIFIITSPQKRGRKSKKSNQKSHDSSSDDNCLLKIQNHFFNFIINLANEALQKENIIRRFILIDYKIKRNVNHDFFCKLKTYSIKKILEMDTSSKYRSKSNDFNRETINEIYDYSNWLNDFFNINYLDLFFEYHNKGKPLLNFEFKGKKIELSKAKSFYYLLNNRNNKGKKIEKDLSNIAKRFFIDDNSTLNKILFQTKETIDLKE